MLTEREKVKSMKLTKENYESILRAKASVFHDISQSLETVKRWKESEVAELNEEKASSEPNTYRIQNCETNIQQYDAQIEVWESVIDFLMK